MASKADVDPTYSPMSNARVMGASTATVSCRSHTKPFHPSNNPSTGSCRSATGRTQAVRVRPVLFDQQRLRPQRFPLVPPDAVPQ